MFSTPSKKSYSVVALMLLLFTISGLTACDSKPPELQKAVKQFESEEALKAHVSHIRKDHMDLLMHKRDETMIRGIRTKENSLRACIDCHVPAHLDGKVVRHDNPKHFCSTCHGYVAAKLDCFQCHVDHPVNETTDSAEMPNDTIHQSSQAETSSPSKNEDKLLASSTQTKEIEKAGTHQVITGESTSE